MQKGLVCGLLLSLAMKPFIRMLQVWCCISWYISYHVASKCAEGKFFDRCLVICQLKFTALRRSSPTSRSYSFHGKVNMQPCFAVTSVSFINGIRMLCVIFNIPFLMQRTRDRIQLFITYLTIRISGVF